MDYTRFICWMNSSGLSGCSGGSPHGRPGFVLFLDFLSRFGQLLAEHLD
jgi:hypothetical protein